MKHRVQLDYTLGEGELADYLDGLREGKAVASYCRGSGRTSFPPDCSCRSRQPDGEDNTVELKQLSGGAEILVRTDGPSGAFALVRFDGADNMAVCRLANPSADGRRGQLCATGDELPGIVLEIVGEHIESV
ncbi:MAG: hypothetical protein AAGC96_18360 [Pseudomonadota bacterium]